MLMLHFLDRSKQDVQKLLWCPLFLVSLSSYVLFELFSALGPKGSLTFSHSLKLNDYVLLPNKN